MKAAVNFPRESLLRMPHYLHQHSGGSAWKEDHRRDSNGALAGRVIGLTMASPVSRSWAGYWQRAAA